MAKEKDEYEIDDLDIDDFGLDSGFDDPDNVKDDRSPVTKITSGALSSIKTTARSSGFYGKILRGALPKSYGEAFDTVDAIGSESVGLYNEVLRDLKPGIKQLKRAAKLVKPRLDPILPKKLSRKLDDLLKTDDRTEEQVQVDADQASITSAMAEVFKQRAQQDEEKQAEETIQKAVDNKRAQAQIDQLAEIRQSNNRMVAWQDGVHTSYLKKSLELQYRHYFAARDQLEIMKASTTESIELLRNINKNTGLPEFVKLRNSEALKEQLRLKTIGAAQGWISDRTAPFIRDTMKGMGKRLKEKTSQFTSTMFDVATGAEALDDAEQMAKDFGMDPNVMAGELAGSAGMDALAVKLGKWLRPILGKESGVTGLGYMLQRINGDLPGMARDWAKDPTWDSGLKGRFIDFIKSSISRERNTFTLSGQSAEDLLSPEQWTGRDSLSLQEIIPGLLTKIYQSTEGIRTGDVPEGIRYDSAKSEWVTDSEMAGRIRKKVVSSSSFSDLDWRTNTFLEALDPDEKLSTEVRDKLRTKLLKGVAKNASFNIKDFTDESNFYDILSADDAALVADQFKSRIKVGDNGKTDWRDVDSQKNYAAMSAAYRGMKHSQEDAFAASNVAASLGNRDLLRRMGIVSQYGKDDVFNNNYVLDMYQNYMKSDRDYEKTVKETPLGSGFSSVGAVGGLRRSGNLASAANNVPASPGLFEIPQTPVVEFGTLADQIGVHIKENSAKSVTEQILAKITDYFAKEPEKPSPQTEAEETQKVVRTTRFVSHYSKGLAPIDRGERHWKEPERNKKEYDSKYAPILEKVDEAIDAIYSIGVDTPENERGIRGAARRAGRGIGRFGRGLRRRLGSMFTGVRNTLGKTASFLTSKPVDWAKRMWKFGGDQWKKYKERIQDVYVMGFGEPKLTADKMREGHYVDAETGDPITKVADIKGAVRDKITGKIVLTTEEFAAGLYNKDWKKIGMAAKGWLDKQFTRGVGFAKDLAMAPFRKLNKARQDFKEMFFTPPDVYVPGEKEPRLRGLLMLRGKYVSSKTGKPIRRVGDIDSDVKDDEGKTVLTLEEFAKGVVDEHGKPIRTRKQKIKSALDSTWSGITKGFTWAKNKVMAGGKWTKDKLKAGWGIASDKVRGMFAGKGLTIGGGTGGFGFGFGAKPDLQVEQVNVLKRIHNMLRKQFGLPGDDLPMTDLVSKLPGKGTWARNAKARALRAQRKMRNSNLKSRITENLEKQKERLSGKYRIGARSRLARMRSKNRYKTWREKYDEKMKTIRKNGWRDILSKRAKAGKDKVAGKVAKTVQKGGMMGKLLAAVMGIGTMFGSALGKLKDIVSGIWSMRKLLGAASAAGSIADIFGGGGGDGKGKGKGKVGKGRAAWEFTKKWGGKALGFGMGVAGTALRIGGTVLAGIASTLSAPVVIGIAAVAALAVAGYYTYRYFKDKLKPLQKVRFTQYGLPLDDRDTNVMIAEIERTSYRYVEWNGETPTNIGLDAQLETLLKLAGISISDGAAVQRFVGWYQNRFKPVYLTHLALMQKYSPKSPLETIDEDMPDQFKAEFAKKTRFGDDDPTNPYKYNVHPIEGKQLVVGTEQIDIAIQEVVEEFPAVKKKDSGVVTSKEKKVLERYNTSRDIRSEEIWKNAKASLNPSTSSKQPVNYVLDPNAANRTTPKPPPAVKFGGNVSDLIKSRGGQLADRGDGIYAAIKQPQGSGQLAMLQMLAQVAESTGIQTNLLAAIAKAESSFRPDARPAKGNAKGLFQFMPKTWKSMMEKYGDKYGIPKGATPFDPVASSLLAAELIRDNARIIEQGTGKPVGPAEIYAGHFMGAGKAVDLLNANPDAIAATQFSKEAGYNPNIFFNRDGTAKTIGQVIESLGAKVSVDMPSAYGQGISTIAQGQQPWKQPSLMDRSPSEAMAKNQREQRAAEAQAKQQRLQKITYGTLNFKQNAMEPVSERRVRQQQTTQFTNMGSATQISQNAVAAEKQRAATLRAADLRKEREKEARLEAQSMKVGEQFDTMASILETQLSVQTDIRDDIRSLVDLLTDSVNQAQGQSSQPAPARRPNPIDISRKAMI